MLSWSRTRVRVAFFSSRPRHTEYETSFLAAPGKFEVRSAGVLDHSKTVELFSLVAISPQTSRVLLKLGYYRVFNLILWVLYTGMQWKGLPVPTDAQGKPAIHYTTIYKVFARWADDGSLWQAFVASVRHLAAEKQLDISVLHGDGTNTVAKKGAMALASRGTNTRRARRSLPSLTIMATS